MVVFGWDMMYDSNNGMVSLLPCVFLVYMKLVMVFKLSS